MCADDGGAWPRGRLVAGREISGKRLGLIGFGSIGRGTLPLIERHFEFDRSRFVVIDPVDTDRALLDERGIRFIHASVTRGNYRELVAPLLTEGGGQGFCVNLSVDVSSLAMIELCREIGALYVDTVMEPWLGFYFDKAAGPAVSPPVPAPGRARIPGGAATRSRRPPRRRRP